MAVTVKELSVMNEKLYSLVIMGANVDCKIALF